jgi:nitroreductase
MDLKDEWYDAIGVRMSRRRFDGRPVASELRRQLEAFCAGAGAPARESGSAAVGPGQVTPPARVGLVDDPAQRLYTGIIGGYAKVSGATLAAAFIARVPAGGAEPVDAQTPEAQQAPDDAQMAAGYLGEALVLEATRLGLGTCWIAGTFDKTVSRDLIELGDDEQVVAVTPLGYPTRQQAGGERLLRTMIKASARLSVEKLAPGILDDSWPPWAAAAVQATRLAPSGANRQPWRFRLDGGSLVLGGAEKLYWTAPIDFGIALLHVELGARHEGVTGAWTRLPAPDIAAFTPA